MESNLDTSETEGFDQLFGCIEAGDVLVGDRAYVSFEAVARLQQSEAHLSGVTTSRESSTSARARSSDRTSDSRSGASHIGKRPEAK